jgi:hypothetical protein
MNYDLLFLIGLLSIPTGLMAWALWPACLTPQNAQFGRLLDRWRESVPVRRGTEEGSFPAYDPLEFLDALTTIRFYDLAGDDDDWPLPVTDYDAELDQHIATCLEDEGLL